MIKNTDGNSLTQSFKNYRINKKISEKYMIQGFQNNSSLQHQEVLNDITLTQTWIIDDNKNDKSNTMGFKSLPAGTWFGIMKINNEDVWEHYVKTGEVKGFSVEGDFIIDGESSFNEEDDDEQILKKIKDILSKL